MTNETGREPDPPRKTVEAAAREGDANDHTQDDSDWLGRLADWIGDPSFVAIWGDYDIDVERHRLQQPSRWADQAAEIRSYTATLPEPPEDDPVAKEATEILRRMMRLEAEGKVVWNDWHSTWEKPRPTPSYDPSQRMLSESDLLERFDKVRRNSRGWSAQCPAHQDRSPSLSIRQGDRWWLVHCFAGCTSRAITEAVGLRVAELWLGGDDG